LCLSASFQGPFHLVLMISEVTFVVATKSCTEPSQNTSKFSSKRNLKISILKSFHDKREESILASIRSEIGL
jgi:hypothetical protein